ncbi:nitrile hydratase accessory protein [Albidovulum sediminicola]|uniref:Nitrile hydratase accessory protein n=1 Tax=Albidovulum sediminicola TaxID=2984331 RepID=A0ABT2Z177_9RHOB|nr:nitrile hydratase accessory protein [Defluviimonas sp. WL0075]MCV2864889.1 nitrile hydratase accessory protein [Defluviimonas sp. WL0075]
MTEDALAPFDEPWQAQLFALTVALSEAGRFSWAEWTESFGATLKEHGRARPLDGQGDYWNAWLVTLEGLLARTGMAAREEADRFRALWEAAYLSTPHGQPVRIAG